MDRCIHHPAFSVLKVFIIRAMTFLALDLGNTRLKWAHYEAPKTGARLLAHGAVFLENIDKLADDEFSRMPEPSLILGCIVAGDAVKRRVAEQMDHWEALPRWVVPSSQEAGVTNGYQHPTRLGADRWVAMIGARHRLLGQGIQKPCVVVMVGTAVTVEALDATGRFLGGFILPGHGIMLRALESGTAGLRVPTGDVKDFPVNTSDALTSGGTFAIAGAVQRMVDNVMRHCGEEPVCLMTGGAGWKMAPSMSCQYELVDSLIFDGLLAIASQHPVGASSLLNAQK